VNIYLVSIIQGIVEGLTEFLPISSTGHLILVGDLLNFTGPKADTFEIFIQLGAILAVVCLYHSKIMEILGRWRDNPLTCQRLTLWHIALAMIPASALGLIFHKFIKSELFSPKTVIIGLIAGGIYLILAEKYRQGETTDDIDKITAKQALGIGCFQVLALWPGFSRAGATIAGGLLLGVNHRASAEFSFLLAIPMMAAATGLDLFKSRGLLSIDDAVFFGLGFVVSFLVAWIAVVGFLKFLNRTKLTPFAYYRFIIAIIFAIILYRAN